MSDGINWLDAQSSCAVWGGDLTSITTERENNLLYTIVNGSGNGTWIGLYDKDGDGNFYWTEGSALNYTNWATGVNVSNNTRDCTELLTDATWNNTNCDDEKHQFICKKESNNITTIGMFLMYVNQVRKLLFVIAALKLHNILSNLSIAAAKRNVKNDRYILVVSIDKYSPFYTGCGS